MIENSHSGDRTYSAAAIAGALAHELNNPLQGVMSLLTILGRECGDDPQVLVRIGQIRSGLSRLTRIIDSFHTAYENLPRIPERITVGDFREKLGEAMTKRQLHIEWLSAADAEQSFYCHWPEVVELMSDALALPHLPQRTIRAMLAAGNGMASLSCVRDSSPLETGQFWLPLETSRSVSGLAVLIDEVAKLGGGIAEFHFDDTALDGIRLNFRTQMI